MTMRDKLAQTIHDCDMERDSFRDIADAIIAALPDMVEPLVWEQWACGGGERTRAPATNFEYSTARSIVREGLWRLQGPWVKFTYYPTKEAAKAAANAHHRAQVLSAFGITKEPT